MSVAIVTPALRSAEERRATISLSIRCRIRGIYSTTVTTVPKELKILANSMPMTPPPTTSMLLGMSVMANRSLLFRTPGNSVPGRGKVAVPSM